MRALVFCLFLSIATGCGGEGAVERERPVRAGPYEVSEIHHPGQLSIFNANPGGGIVGMPVAYGDINGDGRGDIVACPMLAASGPHREREDAGEIHIIFGSGALGGTVNLADSPPQVTTLFGARKGDVTGSMVHVADLDGDGFDDVMIGVQNYDGFDGSRTNAGGISIYYGRKNSPRSVDLLTPPDRVVTVSGAESGDRLGVWVDAADVNGDGSLDLLLGADQGDGPNNDRPDSGEISVIFGGQELPPLLDLASPGDVRMTVIYGIDAGDHLGSTIASADFDGDGRDDLLAAGAIARGSSQIEGTFIAGGDGPENDRDNAGEAYVIYGRDNFPPRLDLAALSRAERVVIYGANAFDVTGEELATGDLNGDSLPDLVLGSLQASGPQGTRRLAGRTYIIFNSPSLKGSEIDLAHPPANVTTVLGARSAGLSGDTVVVDDIDGDAIAELWTAAPSRGTRDRAGVFRPAAGVIDILFGQASWPAIVDLLLPPDDMRIVEIFGADPRDQFAYSMAAGDVNNDGIVDIISNAMTGDGFDNEFADAGEVYAIGGDVLFDRSPQPPYPLFLNHDIQPVFEAACLPCHSETNATGPDGDLRLDRVQNSAADLLGEGEGRTSTEVAQLLVAPGDPAGSYLVEKLDATPDRPPRAGAPMPIGGSPLPARVRNQIREWIAQGARIANEELPPPPPPPGMPVEGFATTFFARIAIVLDDPEFGMITAELQDPPGRFPLRFVGPHVVLPAAEFETITIPETAGGPVDILIEQDGVGTIDRETGEMTIAVTIIQSALGGALRIPLPVMLTSGLSTAGNLTVTGAPLDFGSGTLTLAGIAQIPPDIPEVGGDFTSIELAGSIAPILPPVPTLTDEIQLIFSRSCALVNCHVGDGAADLNLEAGRSFAELVGAPSSQVPSLLRVEPGEPVASYLFEKITNDPPTVGDRMPPGGQLPPDEIEAIRQWIAGGAPEK